MTTSSDKGDRATSLDIALKRFTAALVGLVIGQIVGDNSITVAKLFLYFWDGSSYEKWHVTQASLVVIFVVTCAGVTFGAFMAKRDWADDEQIVWSMVTAVFVALFAIIDQSLPEPVGDSQLPFIETIYYLGWAVGLWLVPVILLPNPDRSFARRIRHAGGLMAVSAGIAVVCWFSGAVLIQVVRYALDHHPLLLETLQNKNGNPADSRRFWLASPSTVNPICGAFFAVAFSPIWWHKLWHRERVKARLWIISFVAFTFVYAAVFGGILYAERGCTTGAEAYALCAWKFSLAFGAIPVVVTVTVLLAFRLTQVEPPNSIGWPVSGRFWWFLPLGLAIGFAAVAVLLGLAPLARLDGVSPTQIGALTIAHTVNGALLGLVLRVFEPATKLIRVMADQGSLGVESSHLIKNR